ncbi:hypothetical protein DDZ18_05405 [Marinicauda salina]|uniref:Uncharacterized protein n=1 Tax=Marinicauda salina TaxID=2135793 RepID=A0A2U2BVJ4_9PROT|nr:hypothetical protein [Marinicauda salina]PWE18010.1 hypothetical protein DDZ18_05405 [Marinicauda salina]
MTIRPEPTEARWTDELLAADEAAPTPAYVPERRLPDGELARMTAETDVLIRVAAQVRVNAQALRSAFDAEAYAAESLRRAEPPAPDPR